MSKDQVPANKTGGKSATNKNSSADDGEEDEEKGKFLIRTGLQEVYEYVLRSLCKAGLPEGNVYEYSALKV